MKRTKLIVGVLISVLLLWSIGMTRLSFYRWGLERRIVLDMERMIGLIEDGRNRDMLMLTLYMAVRNEIRGYRPPAFDGLTNYDTVVDSMLMKMIGHGVGGGSTKEEEIKTMDKSDVILCNHCSKKMKPGARAIGITTGMIVGEVGFVPDENNPWEVYCVDCGKRLEPKRKEEQKGKEKDQKKADE